MPPDCDRDAWFNLKFRAGTTVPQSVAVTVTVT
jgi:hypothetical protein